MAIVVSKLTGGTNNHQTTSEEANGVYTDFVNEGIVGTVSNTSGVAPATGGFAVNATGTPDTNVQVSAGIAYVTGTPTSQNSQTFRVKNSATSTVAISANASGSTKYDWLYISLNATNLNTPNTAGDNVATLVTSRSSSASTDDGTPPTYGYPLAVITVANGFTSITNGNIQDIRSQVLLNTGTSVSTTGWQAITQVPTTITALGNRSYTVLFPSVDLTGTLSIGMRLKTMRSVTAPTQCTSLNGTTQFYSRASASVSGMTFTDDFTVSAWIKVNSYASGLAIASRYNGTSGWQFILNANGQITLSGFNGGSANFSSVTSYQSVPLNKWVHVSANLDMTAFTTNTDGGASGSCVTIDGINVPSSVSRAGTNPTSLIQAGNLEIGSVNGGTLPFNGKIAQVAIFSLKITNATIRSYMSQTLAGTETSLISAYTFSNSINDLTGANNLTANGGATATNADTPFTQTQTGITAGTQNYAIITAAAFSTNTTLTVQVPEGDTIPTSGGVSAVSYSTQATPYGFPRDRGKWQYTVEIVASLVSASVTTGTTYNVGGLTTQLVTLPLGAWSATLQCTISQIGSTSVPHDTAMFLSQTSTQTPSLGTPESRLTLYLYEDTGTTIRENISKSGIPFNVTTATQYFLEAVPGGGGTLTNGGVVGSTVIGPAALIIFDNAYL